jgi:hypothetical protein
MKTLPTDALATALLSRLDTVKAYIVERIVNDYNRAAKRLAVTRAVLVWNAETKKHDEVEFSGWGFDKIDRNRWWNRNEGEMCCFAATKRESTCWHLVYSTEIDMAKVDAAAQAEAEETCLAWYKKLVGKLGAVESATLHYSGNGSYRLTVRKAGIAEEIEIHQQVVWKRASCRGNWFAQFPARIYVGGKFTPEAKFKAMFAA